MGENADIMNFFSASIWLLNIFNAYYHILWYFYESLAIYLKF